MTEIQSLPNEALSQVFLRLYPCSLLTAARVCKRWRALARHNGVWRRHWERLAAALPCVAHVYAELRKLRTRKDEEVLWKSYHKTFLREPRGDHAIEHRLKFQVLSLLWLPPSAADAAVYVERSAVPGFAIWAFDVIVPGVLDIMIHKHAESGVLCTPHVAVDARYRCRCNELPSIEWRQWNRYHTLTRGADSELVAEHRAWLVFEDRST